MKFCKVFALLFCCVVFTTGYAQECKPEYDGFYYFKINDDNSAVLRFFADGEVIATTSNNKYDEVAKHFTLERKDMMLHGKYKWKKCSSNFSVKGDTGAQHYKVEKRGEELLVTITDKASKKSTTRTYLYYAFKK